MQESSSFFDEMLEPGDEQPREPYRNYSDWIKQENPAHLKRKASEAETFFRRTGITFNVYGEDEATERLIASLRSFAETPDCTTAAIMEPAILPLCRAIQAYGQGDYGRAADILLPIRFDYTCVGGSHAQRDLFAQLLIEAAIKAGRFELARALLSERAALRPSSGACWLKYAGVLASLDDSTGVEAAESRGRALMAQ